MNTPATNRIYDVPGVSCDHCKSAIEAAVNQVDGVVDVTVDIEAKTVTVVTATESDDAAVRAAIDDAGYDIA